jgi:putative oxidoreductase
LQTRLFSFLILCTMLVAALIQQAGESWNMLPALGFAWVSLFTMILGSGRFGVDYLISKKLKP